MNAETRALQDHDTTLEAVFHIHGEQQIQAMLRCVSSNWSHFKDSGKTLRVIVTSKDEDRLAGQIRYYFGVLLPAICQQVFVNGQPVAKAVMDHHLRTLFLPHKLRTNPMTGQPFVEVAELKSGKIGIKRMAVYLSEVEGWATAEHGVRLPAREF